MKKKSKIIKLPARQLKKDSGVRPVETEILEADFVDEPEQELLGDFGWGNTFNLDFPAFEIPGLKETRDGYSIELELPRFDLADIKIALTDGNRTVNIEAFKIDQGSQFIRSQIYVLNSAVQDRYTSKLYKGVLYLEFKKI